MDDLHSDPLDDNEVEIISLDNLDEEVAKRTDSTGRSPQKPRFKRRVRALQSVTLSLTAIILLLALLFNYAPTRTVVLHSVAALLPHTPTPLPAGLNSFYLDASPGWGQLFVDGKRINPLPIYGTDGNYGLDSNALILAPGLHHLIWHAPPFEDQHCTISVPPDPAHDTCQYNHDIGTAPERNLGWLITFSVSLAQLAPAQRTVLTQAIQAALDAQQVTTLVRPGEHYAISLPYATSMYSSAQPYAQATQPLRATLHFQLDTNVNSQVHCIDDIFEEQPQGGCWFDGQNCLQLCSFPAYDQHLAYPAAQWVTYGMVRSLWNYSTLNGQPVAINQPDLDEQGAGLDEHRLPFNISWSHNQWHVTTAFSDKSLLSNNTSPFCYPAQDDFFQYNLLHMLTGNIQSVLALNLDYQTTPNPADGCIVTLNLGQYAPPGIPETLGDVEYMERFGVFVALNRMAQKLWPPPSPPMADSYEQQLAQQAATLPNQNNLTVKYSGNVVK